MKLILTAITFLGLLIVACKNNDHSTHTNDAVVITKTEAGKTDTAKKSIKAYVQNKIGAAIFRIQYHSPTVRDRVIWGGLVPFDDVWVTGAHNATSIESETDFIINGKKIPVGKYAFFTIPGKDEWTVIINKNWDQHLADEYDTKEDVMRLQVTPQTLPNVQERLKYTIAQNGDSKATIEISWEKVKVALPVDIN